MPIHSYGNLNKPVLILIHGMLTPWRIWWSHIQYFSANYHVLVPELGGHSGNDMEQFLSIEDECIKIETYLHNHSINEVFAVCGLSLGGVVAYKLWERNNFKFKKLVLDGAPLSKFGAVLRNIMTANYNSIIEKSRKRDEKTLSNFSEYFLPAKHLQNYLEIADHITNDSVSRILSALSEDSISVEPVNMDNVIYMYGTDMNEYLSRKTVKALKEKGLKNSICFSGQGHCYKAIYEPIEWCCIVDAFLNK